MPHTATTPGPASSNGGAIVHLLSAVHQALDLPAPHRGKDELACLKLLDLRARVARASIGRLITNPSSDALDYTSEGDHILHQLADLPPDTYRHDPTEQLTPGAPDLHLPSPGGPPFWLPAHAPGASAWGRCTSPGRAGAMTTAQHC